MYLQKYFEEWFEKENENYALVEGKRTYLKKGYLHFDPKYWLPSRREEFEHYIANSQNVADRSFYPFLKVNVKTPRYRYDKALDSRVVEYKKRPICFASHFDSLIYSFYSHCLNEKYQEYIKKEGFDRVVSAYRTDLRLCNIDFARDAFEEIEKRGECVAVAMDIKGFFNNLSHRILKEQWQKVIDEDKLPNDQYAIFKSITKFAFCYKSSIQKFLEEDIKVSNKPTKYILEPSKQNFDEIRERKLICQNKLKKGIPQGSPISAVLSNIYMSDFDRKVDDYCRERNFFYRRYCDDLLFICPVDAKDDLLKKVKSEICLAGIEVQDKKTEEVLFKMDAKGVFRGFNLKKIEESKRDLNKIILSGNAKFHKNIQYLGFEYNGENVYIRSSSMSRYYRRMSKKIDVTVKRAYGNNSKENKIFKKKLYRKYTHFGKRNFITYAHNAASNYYLNSKGERKRGFASQSISKQVANHFEILKTRLKEKSEKRALMKGKKVIE